MGVPATSIKRTYLLLATILMLLPAAHAQQNADELYAAARKAAFDDKNYTQAQQYCNQALAITPGYTEITLFKARLYAWSEKPDSARIFFEKALQEKPQMAEIYASYADLEYWNHNDSLVIPLLDRGLQYNPASTDLLLRKAQALDRAKAYRDAIILTDSVLVLDRKNAMARALSQKLRDNISKNSIGIRYEYMTFDKAHYPEPWHYASLSYTRQTKIGSFALMLNYADRLNGNGYQLETEAYPRISKTFYTYVNFGYSEDVGIFPQYRAGFSLWANLPSAFEAEAGIRYLYFTEGKTLYTAYLGKYTGNLLIGARTYLTPSDTSISPSYNILARYYYRTADEYIGINLGYGLSPDERAYANLLNEKFQIVTYRADLDFRHSIRRLNIITLKLSFINQEYLPGIKDNQILIGAGYTRRF